MKLRPITKILIVLSAVFTTVGVSAQSSLIEQQNPRLAAESELDLELRLPLVGPKLQPFVTGYMKQVGEDLIRSHFEDVETMRQREVVIVTIATDPLFYPNESRFYSDNLPQLDYFKRFITDDHRFKLVIVSHTDDTGSDDYLYQLGLDRVNAVIDYFESKGVKADDIAGFTKGGSEPVQPNTSRAGRAENRRIEIYIVPGDGLIAEARKNK